jgi:pSer/pThr/pTyr-binding forkhead associated (FHA) protein
MAKLLITDGTGAKREHDLVDDVTTMGRGSGNIIQVKDKEASRTHCRIEKTPDGGHRLVDLKSRNGVKVNGVKVENQALKHMDKISIGDFVLVYDSPTAITAEDLGATVDVAPIDEKSVSPSSGGAPKYVIEVVEGADKGKTFDLGAETLTIGRKSSNKYHINDESASSFHAEISKEPTGYYLTDLGSTNGTKVAGEKVVKTRLSPGTEITIGTTKMVFKNVGAAAEEDEIFGTVVLDTERLERELAEDEASARAALLKRTGIVVGVIAVAVGVIVMGVFTASKPEIAGNRISNYSFDAGVNERGEPEGWRRGVGGRLTPWQVLTDVDRNDTASSKGALVVERDSQAAADEYAECYTPVDVATDRAYTLGGWIRTENAQGAYGLRIRWVGSEKRTATSQVYVMGTQTEWREIKRIVMPPHWARRGEVACFSYGNRGKVYFDDVYFLPNQPGELPRYDVSFDRIRVEPTESGEFAVRSGTKHAVQAAGLFIVSAQDAESSQAIADPEEPQPDKNGRVFTGTIPEFIDFATVRYTESVRPGELGVAVEYELRSDRPLPLFRAGLRFMLTGPMGSADMQAFNAQGKPLRATTGRIRAAKELVFQNSDGERLAIYLRSAEGVFRVEPIGEERQVEVLWPGQVTVGRSPVKMAVEFNTGSRFERLEVDAALEVVKTAGASGNVAAEYAALEKVVAMKDRFAKEAAEAQLRLDKIGQKFDDEAAGIKAQLAKLTVSAEGDARVALKDQISSKLDALAPKYDGPPFTDRITALKDELVSIMSRLANEKREAAAQKMIDQVINMVKADNVAFARAYWTKVKQDFSDTEAYKKAQTSDVQGLIDGAERAKVERDTAFSRLERLLKPYLLNGMPQKAHEILLKNRDYQVHKDRPRFKAFEQKVRGLAEGAPAPAPE